MNTFSKTEERGAIIVEATLVLSAFIFATFTIFSIVNICYVKTYVFHKVADKIYIFKTQLQVSM